MALRASPRKVVPLATGDEVRPQPKPFSGPISTKRVFFCAVVVEGSESGKRLPEEIQELVLSLGDLLESDDTSILTQPHEHGHADSAPMTRKRALTDSSALTSVINELVATERSYVKRLQILKNDYADPLRNFSKSRSTAILPSYEAKTLFGNVDNLLPVNEAFLTDLEKMMAPNGAKTVGGVGDVALRHFKQLRGFEQYKQYYVKREEAQSIFEREIARRSSPFAAYIDRIKYQSADARNRVGLRELLMDPVQRIPRYTLMFRTMIKHMAPGDPQRARLIEADEIASKIALAEADEQTKRATIFYCLSMSIQEFPPDLFSNSRHFIDCIDVEDVISDGPSQSSTSLMPITLHASLILFDDKLLIVKRPGNGEKGCRALAGLNDLDRVGKHSLSNGKRKTGMSFRGVLDVSDLVATDVGGADFHLYLENPPQDLSEKWSNRPFRALTAIKSLGNSSPTGVEADKERFLHNLWTVQAKYRARAGQSVVLQSDEVEVESKSNRITTARTYYNVYQRTAFLQEHKKTKIVVQIDALGSADDIPFGVSGPPFAVIRLQPLAGGVTRYRVKSSDGNDPGEDDIVQTSKVPARIVLTIHQYGLFEFKTNRPTSRPSTPSTMRSMASKFAIDVVMKKIDFGAGSVNSSHRRTKSVTSRSSTYTDSTTTGDDSLARFSHRSTSTVATSVSMEDESFGSGASPIRGTKRPMSPALVHAPERSQSRNGRPLSRASGRKSPSSRPPSRAASDFSEAEAEEDDDAFCRSLREMNASERDLALQLKLARRNSKTQNERPASRPLPVPMESAIYEEEPSYRPPSRASTSRDSTSQCTVTPASAYNEGQCRRSRSLSRQSSEQRPQGPRTPSPLPPRALSRSTSRASDSDSEDAPRPRPTGIPRSKRQSVFPETTPRPATVNITGGSIVEPLSIKKKASARPTTFVAANGSPTRRSQTSPLTRTQSRHTPVRKPVPDIADTIPLADSTHTRLNAEDLLQYARTTKVDLDSAHRAVKRMKIEIETIRSLNSYERQDSYSRPSSPMKAPSTPSRGPPPTKAAQERMEEMQKLMSKRDGGGTPVSRARAAFDNNTTPTFSRTPSYGEAPDVKPLMQSIHEIDDRLARGISSYGNVHSSIEDLSSAYDTQHTELLRHRMEVQNAKRQCELMKDLLTDATAEKDILFESMNEELDKMFEDINLPDQEEAFAALAMDLKKTKEERNSFAKENLQLKQQLTDATLKNQQWEVLLRSHGLIP